MFATPLSLSLTNTKLKTKVWENGMSDIFIDINLEEGEKSIFICLRFLCLFQNKIISRRYGFKEDESRAQDFIWLT